MKSFIRLLALTISLALAVTGIAADYDYDSGYEPKPPVPFPVAYKDYQILPNTVSANEQYAFIYPKRSILYELASRRLFLTILNPFHVLSQIPVGNSSLAGNSHGSYAVNWAPDSSTVVFIAGTKWGPEKVWVLRIQNRRITNRSDLTAAVRREVLADFKKSRAQRYNDYYDFIFETEDRTEDRYIVDENENIIGERGWDLDNEGHVIIDCTCTTDPKELDAHGWTVRFKGKWDISKAAFIEKSFVRVPPRRLED